LAITATFNEGAAAPQSAKNPYSRLWDFHRHAAWAYGREIAAREPSLAVLMADA
jgi:hypothetical protein